MVVVLVLLGCLSKVVECWMLGGSRILMPLVVM